MNNIRKNVFETPYKDKDHDIRNVFGYLIISFHMSNKTAFSNKKKSNVSNKNQ